MSGNLKPAPFALTPAVVRGLLTGQPVKGMVAVPFLDDVRLDDRLRPSGRQPVQEANDA